MANDALKAAAQKEMLRRQAAAELQRRQQATSQPSQSIIKPQSPWIPHFLPSGQPDNWMDTALRLTPVGAVKDIYQAVTDPKEALQKVDDGVRTLANGMSFGFADKLAAKMSGETGLNDLVTGETPLSRERAKSEAAKARLGTTGDAIEMVGMMAPTTKLAQMGVTATRIPGMVGKYGGLLIDSTALGALDAAGHDRSIAQGAGLGLLTGAAGQLIGKGAEKLYSMKGGKPPIPELDDLQKAKTAAYGAVDDAGVKYAPSQVDDLVAGISDEMAAAKLNPMRHPKAASMAQEIQNIKGSEMSLSELDQLRQVINRDVSSSADPAERFFGQKMVDNIDEFIDANGGGDVMSAARAANAKFRKAEKLLTVVEKGERRAASTGSGGNVDNAVRQNIRGLLDNPRQSKFYTPAEKAAMEKVVRGTKGQNALRLAGKLSPQGNGLMTALGVGGAMVNPMLGIPALLGTGAKMSADAMTRGNVDELLRLITGSQTTKRAMTPAQKKAMENMLRAGSVGLLGVAAQ